MAPNFGPGSQQFVRAAAAQALAAKSSAMRAMAPKAGDLLLKGPELKVPQALDAQSLFKGRGNTGISQDPWYRAYRATCYKESFKQCWPWLIWGARLFWSP